MGEEVELGKGNYNGDKQLEKSLFVNNGGFNNGSKIVQPIGTG